MANIENISETEDSSNGWKVYYLKILADGDEFYKIGVCKGSVKKRFSKEPNETVIKILKIWPHDSESKAYQHESKLFKDYPGDRPYIGRCGPLKFGGNTETYSHDVIGGQS